MDQSNSFDSNPSPVFGLGDHQDPSSNDSNRNTLTNYVFNFILSPFKAVASRFSSNLQSTPDHPHPDHHQLDNDTYQDQTSDPFQSAESTDQPPSIPTTNHALSQFFAQKGDQPLTDIETRDVMALIQDSRTSIPHPQSQPTSADTFLPTAFMPNFPSLSRPYQPTRATSSLPRSNSALSSSDSARSRRSPSRTFYIGPGHSLMNPSTRLSVARRKRLGATQGVGALSNSYDDLLHHPEVPKAIQSNPDLLVPPTKKAKLYDQPALDNSSSAIAPEQPNHTALPPPPPRRTLDPSHLSVTKNTIVTPIRPSPLRNFTLPASSPSPQRPSSGSALKPTPPSTPLPKKRKNKADSIMSSVMKEVNLELQNRTPAPSPIKSSEVINPYSSLQRPIRHKRPTAAPKAPIESNTNPQLTESRNRKVQVCLEGNQSHSNDSKAADDQLGSNSSRNPLENMLQQTMPEEFRSTTRDSQSKRKTAQIGQLPERVLKKQRLRAQQKLKASGPSTSVRADHQDKDKHPSDEISRSSTTSQSSPGGNDPDDHEAPGSSQKGNLSRSNNLTNSKNSASRPPVNHPAKSSSFESGKSIDPSSMAPPASTARSIFSSTSTALKTTGQGPDWPKVTRTHKASVTPPDLDVSDILAINEVNKAPSWGNKTTNPPSTSGATRENGERVDGRKDQDPIDDGQVAQDRVHALSIAEIRKHFDHDLLVDYKFPVERDDDHVLKSPYRRHSDYQGIKETVLGFNLSELETFVFI